MGATRETSVEGKVRGGWRWLGRMGVLILLCVVVAGAGWGCWWWEARRRCEASLAAIRERGEPVTWNEVVLEAEPANEINGAWYLRQAWASFSARTLPSGSQPDPTSPAWRSAAEGDVVANAACLDLLRRARRCELVNWGTGRDADGYPVLVSFLHISDMARLLRDNALLHHLRGEDREAVECWRDIEGLSRAMGYKPTTLVQGLIALIENKYGLETLVEIAPEMHMGGRGGLDAQDVRAMIAELENDRDVRESVAQGFLCERICHTSVYVRGLVDRGPWLLKPGELLLWQRSWEEREDRAQSIRNCAEMSAKPSNQMDRYLSVFIPQFTGCNKEVICCVVHRRMIAAMLAIQLYHHERGVYPRTLEELVGRYLEAAPMDPRRGNVRPIGYVLCDGERRAVIYSAANATLSAEEIAGMVPVSRVGRADVLSQQLPEIFFMEASVPTEQEGSTTQRRDNQP